MSLKTSILQAFDDVYGKIPEPTNIQQLENEIVSKLYGRHIITPEESARQIDEAITLTDRY